MDTSESEWDEYAHSVWLETWAPKCPIGNLQRLSQLVGYREREPGRLQLRAIIRADEGVCEAIAVEDAETVHVRVLLCYEDSDKPLVDREALNCPVHVYLDAPLSGRAVIAVDGERALPLYEPRWEVEHNQRVAMERSEGTADRCREAPAE